jgi:hypothetical protein
MNNRGARIQQTARAGEHYVAAELNRRGAYAVTFAGNMPKIDLIASNLDQSRLVNIQVKAKRTGTWQTSIEEGKRCGKPRGPEISFWILVAISVKEYPEFWIIPEWWIRNNIYKTHQAYLKKHDGRRKYGSESKHHSIDEKRIKQWKERWDILGIF